ncbi:protein-tyrosine-phosphatase [Burkholderia sp. SRS-W-2-2016]|uniref:tyrosine-protein phosphatase n=1 Tax=Burkholderia sp. SRS-W-2-2016 TaxID=1926878 RepID=UPI00094B0647|nr:tyrosine-protein phosphatase [Burkholderia sp. SRS-W-2-2016]OLL27368.1 protein-tyrosine-phosphatase [Burkholderia sp. SRS-W-2-2016]
MAVKNLFRLTPSLYRSAKLSRRDVAHLHELGIRKVVSFRAFHSDRRILTGTGISVQRIPINTWNIRDKEVLAALHALRHAESDGPILIHCQHGADRTGMICALYRIVYQNWSKEAAVNELLNGGFGFHAIWKNILHYLEQVDIESLQRQLVRISTTHGTASPSPGP